MQPMLPPRAKPADVRAAEIIPIGIRFLWIRRAVIYPYVLRGMVRVEPGTTTPYTCKPLKHLTRVPAPWWMQILWFCIGRPAFALMTSRAWQWFTTPPAVDRTPPPDAA
jgi:hypothetical protein